MDYDLAVIGAGPGGYVAAIRAVQLGGKVCLIERNTLGGTCLNSGCIPSKVLLHTAKLLSSVKDAEDLGIVVSGLELDYTRLAQRKDVVIQRLNKGLTSLLKARKVDVIQGTARLTGNRQVTVSGDGGETVLDVPKIILASGSEVARPALFPFDGETVITSDEALKWESLPQSILVVGGGPTGCELASAFRDFGAEVHLVELLDQLLPGSDADVAKDFSRAFKKKGIDVRTGAEINSLNVEDGKALARMGDETLETDVAIVCTGRQLNTSMGLEETGIELDGHCVVINDHCQTSVPNIYAIGDISGKALLAHVASRQGAVAAAHAMGSEAAMDYRIIPGCVYTDPEVATVGLTEAEAAETGHPVKSAKFQLQMLGKSQVLNELTGFLKIVGDEETGEILGVHIVGAHATDLIGEAVLAMRLEATVEELAETIHAHPTLSEAYTEAAEIFLGFPIHAPG